MQKTSLTWKLLHLLDVLLLHPSFPRSLRQRKLIAWFHSTCIPVLLYLKFLEISHDKLYHGAAQRFMDYCQCFELNL